MVSTFAIHADRLDVVAAAELAGVDRATVIDTIERLDAAVAEPPTAELPVGTWRHTLELAALTRATMIAGAMDRILDLTLERIDRRHDFLFVSFPVTRRLELLRGGAIGV